jgi:hypothetical protein
VFSGPAGNQNPISNLLPVTLLTEQWKMHRIKLKYQKYVSKTTLERGQANLLQYGPQL